MFRSAYTLTIHKFNHTDTAKVELLSEGTVCEICIHLFYDQIRRIRCIWHTQTCNPSKMLNSSCPFFSCLGGTGKKKHEWKVNDLWTNILLKLSPSPSFLFVFLLECHLSWPSVPARQCLSTRHTPSSSQSEPGHNIHARPPQHRSEKHMEIISERKKESTKGKIVCLCTAWA